VAGIDIDGNGSVDMYPEETRTSITAAGEADTALHEAFGGNLTQITALDTQLGQGPMGRSVAPAYNDSMTAVVNRLKEIQTFAQAMITAGLGAVDNYEAGDLVAAQGFTLPAPLPPPPEVAPPLTEPAEDPGTTAPHATPTAGR
jgi:hypothetical protein